MSAIMDPNDISPEIKQGLLATLFGMLGMAVKIILSNERLTMLKIILRLFVAAVVAIISGYAMEGLIDNKKLLWAFNGIAGFMAQELVVWVENIVRLRMNAALNKVAMESKTKNPASQHAKKPTKRRR